MRSFESEEQEKVWKEMLKNIDKMFGKEIALMSILITEEEYDEIIKEED